MAKTLRAKAAGGRDDTVKDSDGRDDTVKDSDGRDDTVKDSDGRGGQGVFGGGGGGCIAVVAFIGPVGMNVAQLAARMLSGGGLSDTRVRGTAIANVGAAALKESRKRQAVAKRDQELASAYVELQKKKGKKR